MHVHWALILCGKIPIKTDLLLAMFFTKNKYLRIDRQQLHRMIDAIHHHNNASAPTVQATLIDMLDLSFSQAPSATYIGNVISNNEKATIAQTVLTQQDKICAPRIDAICGDELYAPDIVYATCEPHSGYAPSLDHFDDYQMSTSFADDDN